MKPLSVCARSDLKYFLIMVRFPPPQILLLTNIKIKIGFMRQLATLEQELVKEQKLAMDEQETDKEPL